MTVVDQNETTDPQLYTPDELGAVALQSLNGADPSEQEPLDIQVPTKLRFTGTSVDDVNGEDLVMGDVVVAVVTGRVTGIGDKQMKDHRRHEVTVTVQSIVRQQ